jgi:hypothetical protein
MTSKPLNADGFRGFLFLAAAVCKSAASPLP